jgi:tRNA(fMet)-specific endonuclease VapC
MRNQAEAVARYEQNKQLGIAISSITLSELQFGVYNSAYPEKNGENLLRFLLGVEVLDYDSAAANEYGKIRADLRRKRTTIGELDMLIAAHARTEGLTVATNNTREFERVEGLNIEDWVKSSLLF